MSTWGPQQPNPRFSYPPAAGYDPHAVLVQQLAAERDALRVEVTRLRKPVKRANIAGGILIALWLIGIVSTFARAFS